MNVASTGGGLIVPVQMLRFLAAFAVLVGHVEIFAYHLGRYSGIELWRPPLIWASAAGVDLFFAISGFVMITSMRHRTERRGARRRFLLRRLIRIVPLYWLALGFMLAWGWRFGPVADLPTTLSAFAFLPHPSSIAQGRVVPPLEVGWTLNYEMLFYVVFALCLASAAGKTALRIAVLLVGAVLLGLAVRLPEPFASWTDPILLEFAGGMGIALLHGRGLVLPVAVRLTMVMAAAVLVFSDVGGSVSELATRQDEVRRLLTWGVAGWLVLAATVLGPWQLRAPRAWAFGGDISYALYLVHMPLLTVAQLLWRHFRLGYGPVEEAVFAIAIVAASLVAAIGAHLWIEKPLLEHLNAKVR